jgi:colicin import membrane protein
LKSRFKTRSSFPLFDQSVLRAVERSDPLPPFPEGYMKTSEEIEINFNLKELEEQ